jgi:hypothetical protein
MTTNRKIRVASLVAIANGVLMLSFAAPPCEAGKCNKLGCYLGTAPCSADVAQAYCQKICEGSVVVAPSNPGCKGLPVWTGKYQCPLIETCGDNKRGIYCECAKCKTGSCPTP